MPPPPPLTQPRPEKGNRVDSAPEIPTAEAKAYHKDVTLLGSSSVISRLVQPAENKPTVVKDSEQYTIQQLSETVRSVTSPTLIIHCGTNNITREKAYVTINRIRRLEIIIKNNPHLQNVIVSSLLTRSDSYDSWIKVELVNATYKLICESNNWHYIDNTNIKLNLLANDG